MCGIVGIIKKERPGFFHPEIKLFKELFFVNQLRGWDGAGIFYEAEDKKIGTFKKASPATYVIGDDHMEKTVIPTLIKNSSYIIGHNRAATKGEKVVENTHPFREGKIVLVHNGTLNWHKGLKDVAVDSHAICHAFNEKGDEATIKDISGSFALVWSNQEDNTLNLIRNKDRPLHIIESSTFYVICSEVEMGRWILKRNNYTIIKETELTPYVKYTFNLNNTRTYTEKTIERYTPPATYHSYGKKKWGLGDFVRFRTGNLLTHKKSRFYLEGQINKWQQVSPEYILEDDFYPEWSIKYYGKKQDIEKFTNERDIIGEIVQIISDVKKNETTYVVARIEKYIKDKKYVPKQTPRTAQYFEKGRCSVCDKELNQREKIMGYDLCIMCYSEMVWDGAWAC